MTPLDSGQSNSQETPRVTPRAWWLQMQIAFERDTPLAEIDEVYERLLAVAKKEPTVSYVEGTTGGS